MELKLRLMRFPAVLFVLLAALVSAHAEEAVSVDERELPRFPPHSPETAEATFQVKKGFHAELVAAEPLVMSPVAVSFDENGRVFVAEMRDYSEQRDVHPHLGRIRLLEDSSGNGNYDRASVFADDLPWPTAVFCSRGGVFVCAAPDIWWLQDIDGDGRADVREVVFTGFNSGTPKMNVQALPNSFAWGPDHRIHLQTGGGNRGLIRSPKRPDLAPQELAGRDFWFDPQTLEFGFEPGGGQFGMSYDQHGRRIVCNNSDHLRLHLFDSRTVARNPFLPLPSGLLSVAADGPAAEVFRISPDEPWRIVRTRWRVSGKVPGIVEGGGRVSGYFTGATGTTVYRGDAFGPDFVGDTFTGDAGGNLVHHKRLRPEGVSVVGERPPDERAAEFLASRDTWFRPVNFANAPDGTLWVVDMYREVIEHPWSIPEPIKQHLDLTSGRDRGRLWRLVPDGFQSRPLPSLGAATTETLVATLAHPNGWHRDTAERLLWERRDLAAVPQLRDMLATNISRVARLTALRALDGLHALDEPTLLRALGDPHESVREAAIPLSENLKHAGRAPDRIWQKLKELTRDRSPRVRLQLAFTLGGFSNPGVLEALENLATSDADDPWISAAILDLPPESMAPLFARLLKAAAFQARPGSAGLLSQLALGIGARHDPEEVHAAISAAADHPARLRLMTAFAEGLARAGLPLSSAAEPASLSAVFGGARSVLSTADRGEQERTEAARLLGFDPSAETAKLLLRSIVPGTSVSLLRALLESLAHFPARETAAEVTSQWPAFDGPAKAEAARFLAADPNRARALIQALGEQKIAPAEIPAAQAALLRQHRDPALAQIASHWLPAPPHETRAAVIDRFTPALVLHGDSARGHATFTQRCATCHRLRGEGNAFGPDLESVVTGGREKLLTHILDPNREVAPQFAAYSAELSDGSTLAGVLASENPESVVLREPLGRETVIPRTRLLRLQTTGSSPMPEGLEAGLQPQDLADLLDFLTASKAP